MPFIGALVATDALSEKISIADIIQAGLTADFDSCYDFKVKGVCFWIKCTLWNCKIRTSVYVEHYTPEAVVSIYQDFENSPFEWSEEVSSTFGELWGGTTGKEVNTDAQQSKNYVYRHADVYGSPAAESTVELLESTGYACEYGSTAFEPYFISSSNPIFWYTGILDSLLNIGGYARWIGERYDGQLRQGSSELWGHLYPRTGININADHYKSSMVAAQRAVDFVFNGGSLIYSSNFGGEEKEWYVPADETEEWRDKYGKWQMLYPKQESKCHILGEESSKNTEGFLSGSDSDGWDDRRSQNGSYAMHYWRQYECCEKPSGYNFLFKVVYD